VFPLQAIEKIRKENERLKEQLAAESQSSAQNTDGNVLNLLGQLQDTNERYTRKIDIEKRRLEELEKQSKIMQVKTLELQQNRGGVNAVKESDRAVQKQIRVLENRLDKALVKFNEALAFNKQLREEIDNLRRERVVFDQINAKLAKELHEKKKEMAQIIEVSNIAYEARDQAHNEMALLKAHADKEQAQFEQEWRELGRVLEQDRKLKERMAGQERGRITADEEGSMRKNLSKGNWNVAKDKAAQQASLDRVQSFEEAFQQIKAATGIDNIDELVQTFIDAEDQNFSLFNYVNELNNEVEKLEEQIAEIKAEIDKYKGQGGQNDRQRKKLLKDLEDRLASTEARAEQYEAKALKAAKTVSQLEQGIQSIFSKIGCDKSALSDMLGTTGVTESNMMQYLGIIEQRTNELLQQFHNANKDSAEGTGEVVAVIGQGPAAPAGSTVINIDPPVIGDEDDSEDESDEDEERPLSRDELKAKTLRGLTKREGQQISKQQKRKGRKENKMK
jgi:chromosome segregation ATPase